MKQPFRNFLCAGIAAISLVTAQADEPPSPSAAPAPVTAASAAVPGTLSESACAVITAGSDGGFTAARLPSLHVLEATAAPGPFHLPDDAPPSVRGVLCDRSSVVPGPNDYEVVAAGFALYISVGALDNRRIFVLESADGHFRLRASKGTLSAEEDAAVQVRLDEYEHVDGQKS